MPPCNAHQAITNDERRSGSVPLNKETALEAAFEAQTAELEEANGERAACSQRIAELEAEAHAHLESMSRMESNLSTAQAEVRTHAARAVAIELRADELRTEVP